MSSGTQAMIPKARAMFAKRLSSADFEELMRRRTVPEVADLLKKQPYFRESLATLSTTAPHRGQIEELLSMDVFNKYQALLRYDFDDDGFADYYLDECEMREILKALHLISIGIPGGYLNQVPPYLVGKLRVDLFDLGRARNFQELLDATRRSIYYKALRGRFVVDPYLQDFPMTEATLLRQYYTLLFERIDRSLGGQDAKAVRSLFHQEVEVYNLELISRVKAFFPNVYTNEELRQLILPYTHRIPKSRLMQMLDAKDLPALAALYKQAGHSLSHLENISLESLPTVSSGALFLYARRMLHLTAQPPAALASFVSLAKLIRQDVVNVIEGVRYALPPQQIRAMLWT